MPRSQSDKMTRVPVAALLGWALPGLGHLYLGHRARGMVILIAIAVTFWTGVAVGGVRTSIDPQERKAWFLGQICAGGHCVVGLIWANHIRSADRNDISTESFWPSDEIGVVYCGVAGLLNLLVLFDVLGRAERPADDRLAQRPATSGRAP